MMPRRTILMVATLGLLPFPADRFEALPPAPVFTRIVFGGDVMMSRYVGTLAHAKGDPAGPMRDIAPVFSAADIAFVNLEAPFSDQGRPATKGMIFKAAPDMIEALSVAGIDIVSTANNHARDSGAYGVGFTVDWLAKHGIVAVGTAASGDVVHRGAVLERHGIRFGFLAYTFDQSNGNYKDSDERVAMLDPVRARQDIAAMRKRADVVIVSMHAGTEYQAKPNDQQREFARAAIDAGAKVVVGHHPHVVQPCEEYHGGVIFYSLGNLVFDQFQRKETQQGLVAELLFLGPTLMKYELLPVDIVRTAPRLRQENKPKPLSRLWGRPPGLQPTPRSASRAVASCLNSPTRGSGADEGVCPTRAGPHLVAATAWRGQPGLSFFGQRARPIANRPQDATLQYINS